MISNEIHFNQTLFKRFNSSWGGRGDWELRSSRFLRAPGIIGFVWGAPGQLAALPVEAEVGFEKEERHQKSMKLYLSCFGPLKELAKIV